MDDRLHKHIELLNTRYPQLVPCKEEIIAGYNVMEQAYSFDHKLLIAGNGGSAADSEHIAGELMKKFKVPRPIPESFASKLIEIDNTHGPKLAKELERGLPVIALTGHIALNTAIINDTDGQMTFAQQLLALGKPGDVLLAISTSGNSKNVMNAAVLARALDIKVIGLTGANGGDLGRFADVCVHVPENETYMIQELHLPVYHCWCLMLEDKFFREQEPI